ncbi:hypothetical protein CEXT_264821 [Caerostris extrusa]|uniref:Uncharacterized protein n=1 Tax=Caerostris extrusa TaxID=172846 RepID=A0AAV4MJ51_CAEEX|nr:hypothetical protein CEXT_264821 [Caerostris extrusa]
MNSTVLAVLQLRKDSQAVTALPLKVASPCFCFSTIPPWLTNCQSGAEMDFRGRVTLQRLLAVLKLRKDSQAAHTSSEGCFPVLFASYSTSFADELSARCGNGFSRKSDVAAIVRQEILIGKIHLRLKYSV